MKKVYKVSLGLVLLVLLSIFFLKYVLAYLLPFAIALVIASLIDPVVEFIQKKTNFPRGISVIIVLSIIIIFISLLLTISFSRLFIELNHLLNDLPDYQEFDEHIDWIYQQNQQISDFIKNLEIPESFKESISANFQDVYDSVKDMIQVMISSILDLVKKLPKFGTTLIITVIATFFISRDKDLIVNSYLKILPVNWQDKVKQAQSDILKSGIGFIRAQTILITISTLISIIGLNFIGNDYAIILGLISGFLDLIPVIGPSLVFVPWSIFNFIIGNIQLGMSLAIIYGIIAFNRQMLEAKLVGKNVGVHPLAILSAMYLGIQLFGITGVFLGPALVIIVKSIFEADVLSIFIDE